ncbi:hypothetical protein FOA52_013244 [Chlamydomonas sp. UWO 241]|nr:hypothetical protein FOA52_013244 [Chlamydomonas sp. UWO 241]
MLLGVIGPSGSGKTTLLRLLASGTGSHPGSSKCLAFFRPPPLGVAPGQEASGTVRLGRGGGSGGGSLSRSVAFVPQEDLLMPSLTVAETLHASALLRLPSGTTAREVADAVWGVVTELGLAHVALSIIGQPGVRGGGGISGGERRRTSIGVELVTRPSAVVMDEPTSGLDSYSALGVLSACRRVALGGSAPPRPVVLSLHQPGAELMGQLDAMMLLASGHVVYCGPPSAALSTLTPRGLPPPPPGRSLPEHLLSAVSDPATLAALLLAGGGGTSDSSFLLLLNSGSGKVESFDGREAAVDVSQVQLHTTTAAAGTTSAAAARPGGCADSATQHARWPWHHALAVLMWRSGLDMWRRPQLLLLHLLLGICGGVFVGGVFYKPDDTLDGMQARAGAIYFTLCLFGFTSLSVVDVLVSERVQVAREVARGHYPTSAYLTAKLALDGLLLRALPAALYTAAMYPMTGMSSDGARVACFLLALGSFAACVGVLAVMVTCVVVTAGAATLLMNLILLVWVLVGGYLVNPTAIPAALRWLRYATPLFFAFEGMLGNELRGSFFTLKVAGYPAISSIPGETYMGAFGLQSSRPALDFSMLVVFYAGFAVLAVVAALVGGRRAG